MGFRRRQPEAPRVDLTPMIDVVFLLLIFFMISTTFIERPGLDINLPKAGSDQIQHGKEEIQVYLMQNGEIYLQQQPVTQEELVIRLAAYGRERAQKMTFLLMADKDALHGQVIELMDAAKQAGFDRLAIATDKASGH